jgi:exopolysaccharide production protein ExoY
MQTSETRSQQLVHRPVANVLGPGTPTPFGGTGGHSAKRVFDFVAALVLIILLAPLLLLIALAVKATSRGPAQFRQLRVGRGGREFRIRKFRTMSVDAEKLLDLEPRLRQLYENHDHKLPVALDPRVTAVGRILRRTSLDELPQLLNVLRGDMSLVGPRPVRPGELACYGHLAPAYLALRPGLTGLWQVSGRSEVKFPARAELDAEYALRRCLRTDLGILIVTPWAVACGRGAD